MTISSALFFHNLNDFTAFVAATMRAGAMGKLWFVAIGALGAAGGAEVVVRPAGGGPLLGVSSFWIRHLVLFSFSLRFLLLVNF